MKANWAPPFLFAVSALRHSYFGICQVLVENIYGSASFISPSAALSPFINQSLSSGVRKEDLSDICLV